MQSSKATFSSMKGKTYAITLATKLAASIIANNATTPAFVSNRKMQQNYHCRRKATSSLFEFNSSYFIPAQISFKVEYILTSDTC